MKFDRTVQGVWDWVVLAGDALAAAAVKAASPEEGDANFRSNKILHGGGEYSFSMSPSPFPSLRQLPVNTQHDKITEPRRQRP